MARILLTRDIFCLMLTMTVVWSFTHSLNVSRKHSVVQRSTNINHTKIINFWNDNRKELALHSEHKEVVLVMGNTGAGKTTLVLALIGRKLRSTKRNGYLVIVDEEDRIGTGVSSKTLIPEAMTDIKRNVTYIDCSGFRDNRNIEYEISSIYFQNILMNQVEKIKLILVINYESLKVNGNKNDFDDLFEHICEFIKDISKFHDGIALVVTKVENTYEQSDDGSFFLSNDNRTVLKGIADYLKNKKEIYRSKTENPEKYQMFVNLIDVLLQKKNNSYTRIAIFRQPIGQGLLENLKTTKNEIDAITKMTIENLQYVEKKIGDFGFALSKSSKYIVDQIVDDIFRNGLMNCLYKMSKETLTHYSQKEKEYSDIGILREQVSNAYDVISEIQNVDGPQKLFQEFLHAVNVLNISVSLTNLNIVSKDIKALRFFTTVLNRNEEIYMVLLKDKMQNFIKSIENLKMIYIFLNNLQEDLAAYKSQKLKDDSRIVNIIKLCANPTYKTVQNITNLENIVKEISNIEIYQKIKSSKFNKYQLMHLKAILTAFSGKLETLCLSSSEEMTVKGYNVKMSDVVKIHCWAQAKKIQVFVLNKVFIDCTIDKTGAEAQIFIFAPTWEVVGEQKIILDGSTGGPHKNAYAKSATFTSENGANGLPGFPGGPAGYLFGIGKQFTNSEHLEIQANGGKGGPGQHGGNGADGIAGEALSESFFKIKREPEEVEKYFNEHHYKYNISGFGTLGELISQAGQNRAVVRFAVDVSGKPAIKPSNGGDGGVGGNGGYPGRILVNGLGKSVNVKTSNNPGSPGLEGQGGHGGKKTLEGRRVKFNYIYGDSYYSFYAFYRDINWINGDEVPAGQNGNSGSNKNDEKFPKNTSMSLYPAINYFKDFVRISLFENTKESELRTLIHELEKDQQIKSQYDTLALVKEFEQLENQYLKLRNKVDFGSFYNSFLIRVEEFSKSEKILENKKVLSYIYTAALTKVFTLKKKRKGTAVVNLSKYLNTIETSIREIHEAQHLQIVRNYRNDYKNTLRNKIQEANNFIENKIEPEINKLWEQSDNQINAIIGEINKNKNSTNDALESLEKDRAKIRDMMLLRSMLLPLKLAASSLSFLGPIGAGVGVAVTSSAAIAEGMLLDTTSGLGQSKIYSLDPNLKLMSRVTEVFNNKPQQLADKLTVVIATLKKNEEELLITQEEKIAISQKIGNLKTQIDKVTNRKAYSILDIDRKQKDAEKVEKEINEFINSRKDILEKEKKQLEETKTKKDDAEKLIQERKNEKVLRRINDVQSVLNSAEIVFSFAKKLENDKGMLRNINNQISEYVHQLRDLEKMESQVYDIVIPDFRRIEETVNAIKTSMDESSHAKLDLTKWTVRTTLRDVKTLLQKFTHKMSVELRNNLERYMDKLDEGFSILIDIYDRIDSYSDSVKQAEYIAHIMSTPMVTINVTNSELNKAMIDLKLVIQSNILSEKYEIALHAFKQHYFPFAAHVLQKFQLPTGMRFNDIDTLRSNIIEKIKDMKNHIDESEATIGEYDNFVHEKNVFNSNITGSSPFYVWRYDNVKDDIQRLLNGSEILMKADISEGVYYNSVKYNDIGINFKLKNNTLQNNFATILKNFVLTMTMIGNNYYRCGERYYSISFDENVSISYTLNLDEEKNWMNPNSVYTTIRGSHTFLSPYGLWSIKLNVVNQSVSWDDFDVYANEAINLELIGRGYCIEQNSDFNFDICNEYLDTFYNVENIGKDFI